MNIPGLNIPIQIEFHNMAHSVAVESNIRERAAGLDRFGEMIRQFRVTVEAPQKHQDTCSMYHVKIDITVPDSVFAVSHDPQLHHANEDVFVAIHDALNSAQHLLEETLRLYPPVWLFSRRAIEVDELGGYGGRLRVGEVRLHVGDPVGGVVAEAGVDEALERVADAVGGDGPG